MLENNSFKIVAIMQKGYHTKIDSNVLQGWLEDGFINKPIDN